MAADGKESGGTGSHTAKQPIPGKWIDILTTISSHDGVKNQIFHNGIKYSERDITKEDTDFYEGGKAKMALFENWRDYV